VTNLAQITVVLLTCNRSGFVGQALRGVLEQSFRDWKLVASDCSDDPQIRAEVAHILEEHTCCDILDRITVVRQPERVAQAAHLMRVLADVNTPFVALLDDDDFWLPNHLERALGWLRLNPLHGLAISRYRTMDKEGRVFTEPSDQPLSQPPAPTARREWLGIHLRSFYGSSSCFVFRRDAIAGHRFFVTSMVDNHLAISILLNAYQVMGFPEPSVRYRAHEGSSYQKGDQLLLDRDVLRLWLFLHQGWRITIEYPLFPLLVVKSVIGYFRRRLQGLVA
jgi:cellulose synthase/poly-beta-1,6-N-acetylglucosamine synthase-like glycosyltransferase